MSSAGADIADSRLGPAWGAQATGIPRIGTGGPALDPNSELEINPKSPLDFFLLLKVDRTQVLVNYSVTHFTFMEPSVCGTC